MLSNGNVFFSPPHCHTVNVAFLVQEVFFFCTQRFVFLKKKKKQIALAELDTRLQE